MKIAHTKRTWDQFYLKVCLLTVWDFWFYDWKFVALSALPFPEVDWQSRKSLTLPAVIAWCLEESYLECYLSSSRICKCPVLSLLCVTCKENQEKRKQSHVTIGFKDLANIIPSVMSLSLKLVAIWSCSFLMRQSIRVERVLGAKVLTISEICF